MDRAISFPISPELEVKTGRASILRYESEGPLTTTTHAAPSRRKIAILKRQDVLANFVDSPAVTRGWALFEIDNDLISLLRLVCLAVVGLRQL